jgi:uncharacterized glyoxalase superfamily protein PhnB
MPERPARLGAPCEKEIAMQAGSTLIPGLRYKDAHAAIDWLERAFGFQRHAVYANGGTVDHAELRYGQGMVMLGSVRQEGPHAQVSATPAEAGGRVTSGLYVVVPDCDPVWNSAREAGAEVVMELQTMDYGGRGFSVLDPEGYLWSFGEYDPWQPPQAAEAAQSASDGA